MSIQVDSSNPAHALLVVNGLAIMKINQDGSVELPNAPVGTSGSRLLTANQLPFTKFYESPEQIITNGVLLTLAHGLGSVPKLVDAVLVCKVANGSYAPGDVVNVTLDNQGTNSLTWGASCVRDATNLLVRPSGTVGSFILLDKTSTAAFQITNTSWRLVVRAWA